jgi:hypothetical protein
MKNGVDSATALHFHSATALHGSATLPFVIPSEAEGSAVRRPLRGNVFRQRKSWAFGPPKDMKNGFDSGTALHFHSAAALHGSATLPFVIPKACDFFDLFVFFAHVTS